MPVCLTGGPRVVPLCYILSRYRFSVPKKYAFSDLFMRLPK